MKALKITLASILITVAMVLAIAITKAQPAKANNTDLGNLVVLNGLFNPGVGLNNSAQNLAGLIAVDNLTGGGNVGTSNLGNLLVLNGLFNTGGFHNVNDLAGLIAVDRLTGGGHL